MKAWQPCHTYALFVTELPDHTNDDTFKSGSDDPPKQSPEAKKFMLELVNDFP